MNIFEKIYLESRWKDKHGTESGPGSSIKCSRDYVEFLNHFVKQNKITSILDLGCGDFNLMQHVDLIDINYTGIDIVQHVIDKNIITYKKQNINFFCYNILNYVPAKKYDLVLIKDVLQHLSNKNVFKIINCFDQYKKILITNDIVEINNDCEDGGYRGLNLQKNPYNLETDRIFNFYSCGFHKQIDLITN